MLTLRQIEVIRAIMITGTIAGAAQLLNVSAPGISRLMKHTERTLRLKLFERRHGRYVPTPEAKDIFEQINGVYRKVDDLHSMLARIERGSEVEFKLGSVPSICHVMVPRAIERLRRKHPDLRIDINILKIEEALDYLLLGKGEIVAMSYKLDHPGLDFVPLAMGELLCIVPQDHPLAGRAVISAREIVQHPLIGIDPNDPYGRIMSEIFERQSLHYEMAIKARFGTTVCSLVRAGLGIAVIDQFTVAHGSMQGIATIPISEPTRFQTYVAMKNDKAPSLYAETFVRLLREEMNAVVGPRVAPASTGITSG
ncbi:LysR family transcriptional regulator [Bosea sp. CS1GBMeth4]|uniref:LysR family transcriptional regulator n=1 Tax=Bosea sp. CS1GBMeth4 TaxID=1892849 RepID=UPI001647BDF0|nr:LysR family transcriptional regulator [Bosea sp. CS1GBMeth4]